MLVPHRSPISSGCFSGGKIWWMNRQALLVDSSGGTLWRIFWRHLLASLLGEHWRIFRRTLWRISSCIFCSMLWLFITWWIFRAYHLAVSFVRISRSFQPVVLYGSVPLPCFLRV